jgi:hypothetical protein
VENTARDRAWLENRASHPAVELDERPLAGTDGGAEEGAGRPTSVNGRGGKGEVESRSKDVEAEEKVAWEIVFYFIRGRRLSRPSKRPDSGTRSFVIAWLAPLGHRRQRHHHGGYR